METTFIGTAWSLLPPVIAIILALLTKEVYLSLFIGIVSGALLYTNFSPIESTNAIFDMMSEKLGSRANIGILIFLVFLGIMVALMTKAGGSAAYGSWANKRIKNRKTASLATVGLGMLIFVDDYFNCLTVGSVMRPITDRFKISRAKLAYLIDATAAPICIIAPISSWAAAVSGYTSGDGFQLFMSTIPFNLYAILTIIMVIYISISGFDFSNMAKHEMAAKQGDILFGSQEQEEIVQENKNGKVIDLVLPVMALIVFCTLGLIYTGGFFDGVGFVEAFAACDAPKGLVLGSFAAIVFTFVMYIPRKIMTFREFADCIPQGFKMMVNAILILVLAWTLGGFCSVRLEAGTYVSTLFSQSLISVAILPAIVFVVATLLAFSTGTSWGTFSILIPIVVALLPENSQILVITIAAVLAGSVCGDHISPISDTTIMASAGAQCNHINHVYTQIPYALVVAVASFVGYVVAGITQNLLATFLTAIVVLIAEIVIIKLVTRMKNRQNA